MLIRRIRDVTDLIFIHAETRATLTEMSEGLEGAEAGCDGAT